MSFGLDILNTCTWEHLSQHFFIFWITPWQRHRLHQGKSYTMQDRQSSHSNQLHLVQPREEVPTSSCTALHQWAVVYPQISDPGEGCIQQSKVDPSAVVYLQTAHCRKDDTWHAHNRCLRTLLQHRCAAVSCTEFQGKVRRMKSIFGTINCGIIITINNNSVSGDVGFVEKLTKYRFLFLRFEICLLHLVEKRRLVTDCTVEFDWNV